MINKDLFFINCAKRGINKQAAEKLFKIAQMKNQGIDVNSGPKIDPKQMQKKMTSKNLGKVTNQGPAVETNYKPDSPDMYKKSMLKKAFEYGYNDAINFIRKQYGE